MTDRANSNRCIGTYDSALAVDLVHEDDYGQKIVAMNDKKGRFMLGIDANTD